MDACRFSAATDKISRVEVLATSPVAAAVASSAQSSGELEYSLIRGRLAIVAYIHGMIVQHADKQKFSAAATHTITPRMASITLARMGETGPYDVAVPEEEEEEEAELRVLISVKMSQEAQLLDKDQWVNISPAVSRVASTKPKPVLKLKESLIRVPTTLY